MNKIHLIGNAHLDPVWLWQWYEGYAEVKATFRSALDRMKEFLAEVVGVGVMISTARPEAKRVEGARSLLILEGFDPETGRAIVHPAKAYQ